jgi:hypothetical protein
MREKYIPEQRAIAVAEELVAFLRTGPLVPARNRAGTKGLAFSPASGVSVGKPGLKALTGWD